MNLILLIIVIIIYKTVKEDERFFLAAYGLVPFSKKKKEKGKTFLQ